MDIVQMLKALGDETRIRTLNLLKDEELCVCEIEHILGITQSNASRHLTKLSVLKIVDYEKKAQWVYYKLSKKTLEQFPFIKELLENELNKIDICKNDIEILIKYKKSGMTCEDEKFITARQTILSINKWIMYKKGLLSLAVRKLISIDISKYKDSQGKLLLLDIISVLSQIQKIQPTNDVVEYIDNAIKGEYLNNKDINEIEKLF
ncbi:winged helix-turn-helix transcriptional regulator [Clostridium sporogenes]|uniref:metalloregulator ArsR/SmtB family transcription factor n=1 Tax=Clostridium sporogenes TaxID=1509 RepID=UPI0013D8A519|nr:winged helix-turn-helix transcriptional regulator [Clostridium sporogenes]NFG68126.1 winged helix-turn-helix transcriptional regulator [Clostridium sporogenes]